MSLSGKVALVTGAALGLGKAFSEVLLKRGAQVCVVDVNVQAGEATLDEFQRQYTGDKASFLKCDVTDEKELKATFAAVRARYGRLDIVVNNAGIADRSRWSSLIDINLKAVIHGTILAVQAMRKDRGGHGGLVVNVASVAGLRPIPEAPEYSASKYGVMGYTLSWAERRDLSSMGLSFACMCPAFTDTPLVQELYDSGEEAKRLIEREGGIMPVGMVAESFEQLLDTPDKNGSIVVVRKKTGISIRQHKSKSML